MSRVSEYFDSTISRDLLSLVCGRELGSGLARVVFECRLDPSLVIKVETRSQSFQNAMEWEIWSELEDVPELSRWLAPCKLISACGTVLAMARTHPLAHRQYPDRMPSFLTDTKRSNFGMLGRRLVCHDYGVAFLAKGASARLRKVKWWGGEHQPS